MTTVYTDRSRTGCCSRINQSTNPAKFGHCRKTFTEWFNCYASWCDITYFISKELDTVNHWFVYIAAGFSTSVLNQQLTLITFSAQHVYNSTPHTTYCAIPIPRDNRLRHRLYPTPSAGDWPGSSDPGIYAFNFHDWGRDLDMQTNDFRWLFGRDMLIVGA